MGNVEVIEALIAAGASPCIEDEIPLWLLARRNTKKAFHVLLTHYIASVPDTQAFLAKAYSESRYDANFPMQGTALHWASRLGNVQSAKILMEKGANVNDTNCTRGRIPLHFAAEGNHAALIKLLISHGANIQAKDSYGWSPLHSAAAYGRVEAITALIELGADLSAKSLSGMTPSECYKYETFRDFQKSEIISLLEGKKISRRRTKSKLR
eukprot:GILJ01020295.1.p1 GENE.GILJ01020295.1~~GILJ01020295.1.p1  ORF type:complete len:211 (-),score=22.86 GILJ01020295.1:34-666(-)